MSKRINISDVEPKAFQAMFALVKYLSQSGIDPTIMELIKIRVSQINRCAYCINMHTKEARKNGETEQRIYALNAWRETIYYTEQERAALALAEEVTHIYNGVTDETYNNAAKVFDEHKLAQIIMAIVTINGWNRIAISTQMAVGE